MEETTIKKTAGRPKKETEPVSPVKAELEKHEGTKAQPVFTLEDVQRMVQEAVAKATADFQKTAKANSNDENVTVLFIAEVSKDNVLELPNYGSMRPNSFLEIPKKEFGGKFMSPLARKLIEKRHLLVTDGLTEDERIRWNCDYKEGEVLSERVFDHLLDFDTEKICEIFSKLCVEHKRFVARRFITAKEKNDNRVSVEKVKALNELSKKDDANGMFTPVLRAFNAELLN